MMTPQEVAEHAFAKAAFGGYNMAQVDEFLDVLTSDYTALYKENTVLKSKMKVLVDKVEEYRSTEDAMRMTLLAAQKMANSMVAEAEEKKNAALKDAEAGIREQISKVRQELEAEEYRLASAKSATAIYLEKVGELFRREQDYLGKLSELVPPSQKPPDPVESAASEIESAVSKLASEECPPAEGDVEDLEDTKEMDPGVLSAAAAPEKPPKTAPSPAAAPVPDSGAKPAAQEAAAGGRVDFANLQFGRDYEIK